VFTLRYELNIYYLEEFLPSEGQYAVSGYGAVLPSGSKGARHDNAAVVTDNVTMCISRWFQRRQLRCPSQRNIQGMAAGNVDLGNVECPVGSPNA
jgi:hypothetical protein